LLSEKIPEMDMLSIGPNMYDIHTPKERLSLSSSSRVCDLVLDMLKRI
jgi:dipeptidase D